MFCCPTLNKKCSRLLVIILIFLFPLSVIGCGFGNNDVIRYADYGTAGSDFALKLARSYPCLLYTSTVMRGEKLLKL